MYFRTSAATGPVRHTGAPADGGPVGFVGDAVLLADPGAGGGYSRHDLWFPARGDYRPTWASFFAVYGSRSAGNELVAARSTSRKDICISLVKVDGLAVEQGDCGLLEVLPYRGWVSPNGRWLVVADTRGAQVFDLSVKLRLGARLEWSVQNVRADAAWVDPDTIALHSAHRLVVLPLRAPATAAEYVLPPDAVIVTQ
jgi:hypothetical protein